MKVDDGLVSRDAVKDSGDLFAREEICRVGLPKS